MAFGFVARRVVPHARSLSREKSRVHMRLLRASLSISDSSAFGRLLGRASWIVACISLAPLADAYGDAAADAARYVQAVARVNEAHARAPGATSEEKLRERLPADARSAFQRVLQEKSSPAAAAALAQCAEAALDLDLLDDFNAARDRLQTVDPAAAGRLGTAVSRSRFMVRVIGEFAPGYVDKFADLFAAILSGYDQVFGFAEFSKVPGKKLRVRLHLESAITEPPHFAPEYPWHSQIDFPVAESAAFRSPTPQGHFLFYGLCHELGHVIAMWGDPRTMEDHHTWAHYTGVTIVEHLANERKDAALLTGINDVRWRSLSAERKLPANAVPPSTQNAPGVMALWIALHDAIGARGIGEAINFLDREGKSRRVNRVRYYTFVDLKRALATTIKDPARKKTALDLLDDRSRTKR
jgi:hypothetical protein